MTILKKVKNAGAKAVSVTTKVICGTTYVGGFLICKASSSVEGAIRSKTDSVPFNDVRKARAKATADGYNKLVEKIGAGYDKVASIGRKSPVDDVPAASISGITLP